MTPLEIEILLHYYSRGDDYRDGDFSAPAVRSAIDSFRGVLGLLQENPGKGGGAYHITERGKVYVAALMDVPLPEQRWVMPTDRRLASHRS